MAVTINCERGGTVPSTRLEDWLQQGVCSIAEPDALFVRGAAQLIAKKVCLGCPVVAECLADSLDNRTEFGVWGGMTERQRRALLKRRPDVTSWRALFEADRIDPGEPPTLRVRNRPFGPWLPTSAPAGSS